MGIFKNKKTGEPSKFAEFVKGVGDKISDINPLEILTSSNPIGTLMGNLAGKDDEVSAQFKLELEQRKEEFEKDWELAVFSKEVEDKASARNMYTARKNSSKENVDKLAKRIMDRNPIYIGVLVAFEIAMILWIKHHGWSVEISASIGTTSGMIIQSLLNERKEIVGFFFGSSFDKSEQENVNISETINKL